MELCCSSEVKIKIIQIIEFIIIHNLFHITVLLSLRAEHDGDRVDLLEKYQNEFIEALNKKK